MITSGLHPVYKPKDPTKRYKGIAIVVALHIVIGYGIISGTARNALLATKKTLEAVVIQEVIIPPPPPPPPPPKEIKPPDREAPKVEAPPPPFIPPPDVAPSTAAPAIASVATPPPAPAPIAPPPPPAPPPVVHTPPNRSDIKVACPTQVAPEMPRKAIQDGAEGIVKAQAVIKDGVITEVTILSGPRVFHGAVRAAMMQYKCVSGSGEITATQEFNFKLE